MRYGEEIRFEGTERLEVTPIYEFPVLTTEFPSLVAGRPGGKSLLRVKRHRKGQVRRWVFGEMDREAKREGMRIVINLPSILSTSMSMC